MSFNIELPQFSGTGTAKLEYLYRYLFRAVEQINWALNTIENGSSGSTSVQIRDINGNDITQTEKGKATFEEIKSLIISSAEIVDAYYESISKRLKGTYVAESDFGKYKQLAESELFASADSVNAKFETLEGIGDWWKQSKGCIIAGTLPSESGEEFGVQIGQTTIEGEGETQTETFEAYLVLTPSKIIFKDSNGTDVAYISQNTLRITNAEILQTLKLGPYVLETHLGLAFRWIGD